MTESSSMLLLISNFTVVTFFCLICFKIMYGDVFFNSVRTFKFWWILCVSSICLTALITIFELKFLPW